MFRTRSILLSAITASLAGFLFGFDTIVISGAEQAIQEVWNTSDFFHGTFIMSMALWGTVIGALTGGYPSDYFGRKNTLIFIGFLYFFSALGSALAPDPYLFSFSRFIGGLGVGASTVAAPIYISEITPPENRGRLVASYQFNIVFGILLAYLSNYFVGVYMGEDAWRWMMGMEIFPAAIYAMLAFSIPESPRWLTLHEEDEAAAASVLNQISPDIDAQEMIQSFKDTITQAEPARFFSGKFSYPIMLAFLIAFFNQFSGINFVLYYAPRIIEQAGVASSDALGVSISIGAVNMIFTLVGLYLIDRAGRKSLMYLGSIGYILSLAGVSWSFYSDANPTLLMCFIGAFIASHAVGQGAVIWVFISEIFPNEVRGYGTALGTGTHWVCAAVITLITPTVLSALDPEAIFAFFSGMMVLQLLFVAFMMPETKNKSLEDLEDVLLS
jgi:sugar porter (SP) family MFS transporter